MMAYFATFTTVLEQMIVVHGFTSRQASYLGALFNIGGIIGGISCSIFLAKKSLPRKEDGLLNEAPYRPVLVLISFTTFITGACVYLAMI